MCGTGDTYFSLLTFCTFSMKPETRFVLKRSIGGNSICPHNQPLLLSIPSSTAGFLFHPNHLHLNSLTPFSVLSAQPVPLSALEPLKSPSTPPLLGTPSQSGVLQPSDWKQLYPKRSPHLIACEFAPSCSSPTLHITKSVVDRPGFMSKAWTP